MGDTDHTMGSQIFKHEGASAVQEHAPETSQPRYINDSTASVAKAVASCASANTYGPGRVTEPPPAACTSASTTHELP